MLHFRINNTGHKVEVHHDPYGAGDYFFFFFLSFLYDYTHNIHIKSRYKLRLRLNSNVINLRGVCYRSLSDAYPCRLVTRTDTA